MAWSFSRPSAKRAARVLGLSRAAATGDGAARGDAAVRPGAGAEAKAAVASGAAADPGAGASAPGQGGAPAPGGELYDPATGVRVPAGLLTAVVCGDPDAAGRLADRLGGHSPSAAGEESARYGGLALDDLPLAVARATVLVQDKDPVLLSGTLADLLDVPSSGRVRAREALAAAQCGDVLEALAQSLTGADASSRDAMRARITERGRSLSGGQRQRLALARSLVTDPEVLVLDEPTSAVDAHTEARIARGLREIRSGRTTVVLTSSPLVLDRADRVVFVDEGTAAAAGGHHELLRSQPRYRAVVTREDGPGPGPAGDAPAAARVPHDRAQAGPDGPGDRAGANEPTMEESA